jgi:tRNA (guanine-N7-)-methyltransferase
LGETEKPRARLYGRAKGKPLSPRRTALMADVFPKLALDLTKPAPRDLRELFPAVVRDVALEIGFGGGEHLIAAARAAPDTGFIGVEPFENGMAKAVTAIADENIANVRLFNSEASLLLDWLPAASLTSVDLLYPDPWPKKRHWKRRFVSNENLDRFARTLAPGGVFRFASDIPSYVEWTLAHVLPRGDFVWSASRADDWRKPYAAWSGTRYEAKALREGRVPTYLTFQRAGTA